MQHTTHRLPYARDHGLVCRDLPDGLMVYDEERNRAHSLNRMATFVWRHCDGQTSIAELTRRLQLELDIPADEAMVWLALERLGKEHLLREQWGRPENPDRYSRRAMIHKLGKVGVAAALVPLITSIAAPRALAAQSQSTAGACAGKSVGAICTTPSGGLGTCKMVDSHLICKA